MTNTSLDKAKIKILLLEGVHQSAVDSFREDGYTNIEYHPKSLAEPDLFAAAADAHFIGIRSATHLTGAFFERAARLAGVGCFCIGTNQVDLEAAQDRGIPVFNAPFSNTRSVAELVLAEIIMLLRGIPYRSAAAQRGGWIKTACGFARGARQETGHRGLRAHWLADQRAGGNAGHAGAVLRHRAQAGDGKRAAHDVARCACSRPPTW